MELMSLKQFLFEKREGISRKKLGQFVSYEDIRKFLERSSYKSFKNSVEFIRVIDKEFNTSIEKLRADELKHLVASGIVIKNKNSLVVPSFTTSTHLDKEVEKEEISGKSTTATKVSSLSKGTAKKLKIPQGKSEGKYQDFLDTVLMNMLGESKSKLLLTGDPGTGKCLEKDYIIDVEFSEEYKKLFEEFKEFKKITHT